MQWIWNEGKKAVRKNKAGYEIEMDVPKIVFQGKWIQHE
jgi:hypothetical protein